MSYFTMLIYVITFASGDGNIIKHSATKNTSDIVFPLSLHIVTVAIDTDIPLPIDGSTDRCCIAIVTNERALLSVSDQPVRKLGRLRILYVRRENKRSKTATFAQWYMVHC